MEPAAVIINDVVKRYGKLEALKGINLEIADSELFGFIGPDGSGKTSLFRILVSLLIPEEGSASMAGYDVKSDYRMIRRITGYMPERFSLYQDLSVEENLKFFAGIFKASIEENYYLIEDIFKMLEPFKKRLAGRLSGGMKQKLALSCALIHKPKVLILDEPTTGVDAVSRKEFWGMLKKLRNENITILVSTPYMDEAGMCDRVALIQKGEILGVDTPEGLIRDYSHKLFAVKTDNMYRLLADLKENDQCYSAHRFGEYIHLALKNEEPDIEGIKEFLGKKGHEKIHVERIDPEVEDCFMELMHGIG
jgi:ABC-type multidrug transport system ATPase subunit